MAENNQKRKDILISARALFKEKGFHNTKMEEIALKAGVGKGTLYEYFTSKQEIFDETCIDRVTVIRDAIEGISNKSISFKEKLSEMISIKAKCIEFEGASVESIMSNKNIVSEKVVIAMMSHVSDMYKIIIKIIKQGKEEGVVNNAIPSELIACLIVGTTSEYARKKHFPSSALKEDDVIINLLFNGFGVQ
ncbi:MAG: TetR/AcrR family transcriptional regulator [Sedimentibacter sp.]|uniref:TetR/AcrR family transcriptional regulator n=1 Tax=Sedimentibacter sp. TaxID=1960295 RepID=UPI0029829BA3|nr:TetR/AcrR family transcriptional regulator [Sedimentibacter sp.]MDW5299005.1 TetR/AcrR family transcriptional regulator [Sedimentibacter sp.]